jgi:hypothetical protein
MKFRLLLRAAGLLAMLVTIATRPSQANSPCPPDATIPQTGTLLEVRAGATAVAAAAILNQVPQHVCVSPDVNVDDARVVKLNDCWFPDVAARAAVQP